MTIIEPYMNKHKLLTSTANLTLEADPGESFLVKNIYCHNPANNYINVTIDKSSIICLRVGGDLGSHIPFPQGGSNHSHSLRSDHGTQLTVDEYPGLKDGFGNDSALIGLNADGAGADKTFGDAVGMNRETGLPKTLLELLWDLEIWRGIPIAEGQKMTISEFGSSTQTADILVEYIIGEAGDYTKDQPNGTEAKEYIYINYADTGAALAAAGENKIDSSNIPGEYVDFPIGKDVPARTEIDLIGILASTAIDWDGTTDYTQSTFLKLIKDRETLFDEDKNGILMQGIVPSDPSVGQYIGKGISPLGNFSTVDNKMPFFLPEPLTFISGEELLVYFVTAKSTTAGSITQAANEIGLIQRVRKIS